MMYMWLSITYQSVVLLYKCVNCGKSISSVYVVFFYFTYTQLLNTYIFTEGLRKEASGIWNSIATKVIKRAKLEAAHSKQIQTLLKDICKENLEGIWIHMWPPIIIITIYFRYWYFTFGYCAIMLYATRSNAMRKLLI